MSEEKKHQPIVEELKDLLNKHPEWTELLESSIKEGVKKAEAQLKTEIYKKLEPWPFNLEDYYDYLDSAVKIIPTEEEYVNQLFLQVCKFYWLLDQPDGRTLQKVGDDFINWMRHFAENWGNFLNTAESLTAQSLESFYANPNFNLHQYVGYVKDPAKRFPSSVWMSFNQFFARQLKAGMRPIADIFDDKIITSPADCNFQKQYPIDENSKIVVPDSDQSKVTIKITHRYDIHDLLEGSPYKDSFAGGTFMHGLLRPYNYHRFHAPVQGTVLECRSIQAQVYLDVIITPAPDEKVAKKEMHHPIGEFENQDIAGYQLFQTRGLIVLDSPIGLVAVLPVGMGHCSSVQLNAVKGTHLNKGDEIGYFQMGGSDIILLFQPDSGVNITAKPGDQLDYGTCIAKVSPNT